MPKIGDRHFAYTPEGMAAAERYKQSIGMNAGGMLGFRPLGYADGDLVEKYAYQDAAARQAAIDFILSIVDIPAGKICKGGGYVLRPVYRLFLYRLSFCHIVFPLF